MSCGDTHAHECNCLVMHDAKENVTERYNTYGYTGYGKPIGLNSPQAGRRRDDERSRDNGHPEEEHSEPGAGGSRTVGVRVPGSVPQYGAADHANSP